MLDHDKGKARAADPGGPGNPYYRRQAELKRQMLDFVTDVDVNSVMRVLLGIARSGDLAAIKLFLEYTIGKPNPSVDPDKVALHEWEIQKQTPKIEEVAELLAQAVEPELASQATRDMAEIVGACHLATIGRHLIDGVDPAGNRVAPPLHEVYPEAATTVDKRNSATSASARTMSAGVRGNVQPEDNGAKPDMNELIGDLIRTVQTSVNGREKVLEWFRTHQPLAKRNDQPDTR